MYLKIGEAAKALRVSVDTLRYYEKIGLVQNIQRSSAGVRLYSESDVTTLKFIRRAQSMNFTLGEIQNLIHFRLAPETVKPRVRAMVEVKLNDIEKQIEELQALKEELSLLTDMCRNSEGLCPILNRLDEKQ